MMNLYRQFFTLVTVIPLHNHYFTKYFSLNLRYNKNTAHSLWQSVKYAKHVSHGSPPSFLMPFHVYRSLQKFVLMCWHPGNPSSDASACTLTARFSSPLIGPWSHLMPEGRCPDTTPFLSVWLSGDPALPSSLLTDAAASLNRLGGSHPGWI